MRYLLWGLFNSRSLPLRPQIQTLQEGLLRWPALGSITAVGAFAIIELQVAIEVVLKLRSTFIDGLAKCDREKLLLESAMETFTETVGLRRADLGAMLNLADLPFRKEALDLSGVREIASAGLQIRLVTQLGLEAGKVFDVYITGDVTLAPTCQDSCEIAHASPISRIRFFTCGRIVSAIHLFNRGATEKAYRLAGARAIR